MSQTTAVIYSFAGSTHTGPGRQGGGQGASDIVPALSELSQEPREPPPLPPRKDAKQGHDLRFEWARMTIENGSQGGPLGE